MKVAELMTKDCKLVRASDTVQQAAEMMAEEGVGCLPVEDNNRLVGMITDRDIVTRCVAQGKDGSASVRDVMTKDVKYCFDDEDLGHTLENMAAIQLRRFPVMNRDKRLVGIFSLADAAKSSELESIGIAFCSVVSPGGAQSRGTMQ